MLNYIMNRRESYSLLCGGLWVLFIALVLTLAISGYHTELPTSSANIAAYHVLAASICICGLAAFVLSWMVFCRPERFET